MSEYESYIITTGISFIISYFVVKLNNFILSRYICRNSNRIEPTNIDIMVKDIKEEHKQINALYTLRDQLIDQKIKIFNQYYIDENQYNDKKEHIDKYIELVDECIRLFYHKYHNIQKNRIITEFLEINNQNIILGYICYIVKL